MVLIVFLGAPGSGKGTQAARLTKQLKLLHLSTGEMLRQAIADDTALGRQAHVFLQAGNLAPDPLVVSLIMERLAESDCRRGAILDGFPRNLAQAAILDRELADRQRRIGCVIRLVVDASELERRLLSRGREDDTPEVIAQRLEIYGRETEPLAGYYGQKSLLDVVDGMGSPQAVFERVLAAIDRRRRESGFPSQAALDR